MVMTYDKTIIDDIFSAAAAPAKEVALNKVSTTTESTTVQVEAPEYVTISKPSTKKNPWDTNDDLLKKHLSNPQDALKPLEEFDELPTDEEQLKQTLPYTIPMILQPSNLLKSDIEKYLINNNIKKISANEYTNLQSFKIGEDQYILDDETHLQNIYDMISTFNNKNTQLKVLRKQRTLTELLNDIPEEEPTFELAVLKELEYTTITKLIKKAYHIYY